MPAQPYSRIHRWYNYWRYQNARVSNQRLVLVAATIVWPFRLFYLTLCDKKVRIRRKRVWRSTGKSKLSQFFELIDLGMRHGIPPRAYYLFRLFEGRRRAIADQYIHRFETKRALFGFLTLNLGATRAREILNDKALFAEHCRVHGLPAPAIFLEVESEVVSPRAWTEPGLPAVDLIVKRKVGKGGRQMMRWEFVGGADYRSATGDLLDAKSLLDRIKKESVNQPLLVVRRLRNHPEIADLAGRDAGVLTTARMVTGLDENGEPELLSSTFKIAVNQTVADNVHFGGLALKRH